MARRYGHRRPSDVGWTIALVILILAALRAVNHELAVAVAAIGIGWLIVLAFIRSWSRHVARREYEDVWGRRL